MREDDYIRRGDVVRDIEELSFTMSMCVSVDECKGMKSAQKIIASIVAETIPAADVVERKVGRWVYSSNGTGWRCSECNAQAPFWCMASTQNLSNYCPNCGADMRESPKEGDV